jgi:putative ABC transport system permease protein
MEKSELVTKVRSYFFEEELNESYSMYRVLIKIVGFLGLLAIIISLLGMLSMVVYTAETKAKEVSIRKVFGASLLNLNMLLSKEYLKLLVWAILFSAPVTAYLIYLVLPQLQYYSVSLTMWDILISTLILLGLGFVTVWSQTNKAALANPSDTLKSV